MSTLPTVVPILERPQHFVGVTEEGKGGDMNVEDVDVAAPRMVRLVTDGLRWAVEVLVEQRAGFLRRKRQSWVRIPIDGFSVLTDSEPKARAAYASQIARERAGARGYTTVDIEGHYAHPAPPPAPERDSDIAWAPRRRRSRP